MYFYLRYKGDDARGSGLPVWVDVNFPIVEKTPGLDKNILNGDEQALKIVEDQDILFHKKIVDFDFFDAYKNLRIVSEEFLNAIDGLNIDFSFARVNALAVFGKNPPARITHKKYFLFSVASEIDSIDLQTSEYRLERDSSGDPVYSDVGKPKIKYLYKLLIDEKKVNGLDIFRPKEQPARFVVSERFLIKARNANLKGLDIPPTVDVDLMDIPGFRPPKRIIDKI